MFPTIPRGNSQQRFNRHLANTGKLRREAVSFKQSHGGSGDQARAVIDGLGGGRRDVALACDVDAIARRRHSSLGTWQKRLRSNSAPYTSTIVFLVRKGNPKGIRDGVIWPSLEFPSLPQTPRHLAAPNGIILAHGDTSLENTRAGAKPRRKSLSPLYTKTCRCWTPEREAPRPPLLSVVSAMSINWENEAFCSWQMNWARTSSMSSCPP